MAYSIWLEDLTSCHTPLAISHRLFHNDFVPLLHHTFGQHPRVHSAPARVLLLRNAREVLVFEPAGVVLARRRVTEDFRLALVTHAEPGAWPDLRPGEAGNGEILACRSRNDRMAFLAQRLDDLQ